MVFKLNISEKEKAWKLELDSEDLIGKKIGDNLKGEELKSDLAGYDLEITGTSDKAGFPGMKDKEGPELKKALLTKGWGMKDKRKGVRLRKTIRGNTISPDTIQINLKVLKAGHKKLHEIFPEQNQPKEKAAEQAPDSSEAAVPAAQ